MRTLRDEVRYVEESHKFDGNGSKKGRRLAALLWCLSMHSGSEDEWFGDVESSYGYNQRYGRHILTEDTQGFVSVTSFSTEQRAKDAFMKAEAEWVGKEDEEAA